MSVEKAAELLSSKYKTGVKGSNEVYAQQNPFHMFVNSMASAMGPEMIGLEPLEGVEQYRSEHPIAGIGSQFAGIAVPYLGAAKIGTLPKVAGMLDKVGDANTILGGAKRGAALYGGLVEAPRVAGSVIAGGDIGETVDSALFNTAAELGFGGLG